MMRLKLLFAASAAAFALASQASATIVTVTYQGEVSSGTDVAGLFGRIYSQLGGDPFKAVFEFNTASGYTDSFANFNEAYGGSVYHNLSPALYAAITINGVTQAIDPTYYGVILGQHTGSGSIVQDSAQAKPGVSQISFYMDAGPDVLPDTINQPFHLDLTGDSETANFTLPGASGRLDATSMTETLGAVPEPATWVMLLLGIGGLGLALRARRSTAASPVAA